MTISTISRLLFAPGLDSSSQAGRFVGSVGVVLDDRYVVWGDCVCSAEATPLSTVAARESIESVVSPALVGCKLEGFRGLAGAIESLTEIVTAEEPIPTTEEDSQTDGISRRDLLTGRLRAEARPPSPPPTRFVTSGQPLHPALRYGLSQALLAAVAQDQGLSIAEVIAHEYNLSRPTAVPLLAQLDTNRPLESLPQPSPHITALGYTVPPGDPADILGDNGVILQRFLRILKERVMAMPGWDTLPRIHVDLRGGLGELYGNNTGQMLGALVGLETSVRPLLLLIEHPIGGDSLPEINAKTRELQEFLRFRKVDVELAAGNIGTLETARTCAQADACTLLNVTPARVGGLAQSAEAVLACRENDKFVMLSADPGDSARSLQVLSQVALGLQADFVGVSAECDDITLVHGEMERALVEMRVRG